MIPECAIDGCPKPTHVRGWCKTHYSRWKRLGDANATVTRWTHQAKTCSVDGCDRRPNARNLCTSHYNRWVQTGSTDMAPERVIKPCSVGGCEEPNKGRGLCSKHYERWRRYGDPLHVKLPPLKPEPRAKPQPPGPCEIDGCERKRKARGLCELHYNRWRTHGDPLKGRKTRKKPEPKPEPSPIDVPDHLAAFLERRRRRQEGDLRRPKQPNHPTTHLAPTRPANLSAYMKETVKR